MADVRSGSITFSPSSWRTLEQQLATAKVRTPREIIWRQFKRNKGALIGTALLAIIVASALLAPLLAPFAPDDQLGPSRSAPSLAYPMGTDVFGRDILSRVLFGG